MTEFIMAIIKLPIKYKHGLVEPLSEYIQIDFEICDKLPEKQETDINYAFLMNNLNSVFRGYDGASGVVVDPKSGAIAYDSRGGDIDDNHDANDNDNDNDNIASGASQMSMEENVSGSTDAEIVDNAMSRPLVNTICDAVNNFTKDLTLYVEQYEISKNKRTPQYNSSFKNNRRHSNRFTAKSR